jgi:PAS domain S-box-containing protein
VTLNDRLRPLTDALEIQTEAVCVLGEHLQTDWVHLAEYDEDLAFATIRCEYVRGEVQRLAGRHPVERIGPLLTVLKDGHTVAESDMATSALVTPAGRAMYAAVGVRGHVAAPVVKRHQLLAAIGVCDRAPRAWTAQEIALIEATAERTWAALERARAERALRDSEARLQLALGMSNMGTFVWHIQADRGEFDARMLALFGLREDERFSLTAPSSVMHPDDRTRYARAVAHAIDPAGPGALREEVRVLHPDGDERWLFIAGQTVFEPEMGQAVRMSGMAADITERKNRENALVFLTDLGRRVFPCLRRRTKSCRPPARRSQRFSA